MLGNADRPLGQDKGMQDGHAAGVMGERDQLQGYTLYAPTSKSKKKIIPLDGITRSLRNQGNG